jgi:S-adenosylmethionine:tRNA ribosyltransferase-isomerase
MHSEQVDIPSLTWAKVQQAIAERKRVWALGTTVTRALESAALGLLEKTDEGHFRGETKLLIQDDYEFRVVSGLLTNFHQPGSTLLALVSAFAGHEQVLKAYQWAIEKRFRLFSYGDLSVWKR